MLGVACKYNPQEHEILQCELAHWLAAHCHPDWKDRLFVYRHRRHNTFVIGVWAYEVDGCRYFHDALNLGETLRSFTRQHAQQLYQTFNQPADNRNFLIRHLRESHNQMMRDLQESEREKADRWFGTRKTAEYINLKAQESV